MPTTKKSKDRTYLTEEEKTVLGSLLPEWNGKPDKKSRDSFVSSEVLPKIQQMNQEKYGAEMISKDKQAKDLWERRIQAIHTWFKNNKPFKDRTVFKLERRIPVRRVIAKLNADLLHDMIVASHPETQKGDKAYPGLFQQMLSEYAAGLTKDEMAEMEKTRDEWQADGPPIDVRLRAAKKYSRKGISNAHQLLQKQMYVACITFSFYPDPDSGVFGIVCHDYIADLHSKSHGKRFKTFKEWNDHGFDRIIQDMLGYAKYVDSERKADPPPLPVPVSFDMGPGMLPLLPAAIKGLRGMEVSKDAKEVVRAYFLRHYQMAKGCDSAHTPWAVIGEHPGRFFDIACLPDGFKFQDPSRMGIGVKVLLNHLRDRQEEFGVNAFHFHHILRNNQLEAADYPQDAQEVITAGAGAKDLLTKAKETPKIKSDKRRRNPTAVPISSAADQGLLDGDQTNRTPTAPISLINATDDVQLPATEKAVNADAQAEQIASSHVTADLSSDMDTAADAADHAFWLSSLKAKAESILPDNTKRIGGPINTPAAQMNPADIPSAWLDSGHPQVSLPPVVQEPTQHFPHHFQFPPNPPWNASMNGNTYPMAFPNDPTNLAVPDYHPFSAYSFPYNPQQYPNHLNGLSQEYGMQPVQYGMLHGQTQTNPFLHNVHSQLLPPETPVPTGHLNNAQAVDPPSWTPETSSPVKSTPKRKRSTKSGSVTATPTRPPRLRKTPKKYTQLP